MKMIDDCAEKMRTSIRNVFVCAAIANTEEDIKDFTGALVAYALHDTVPDFVEEFALNILTERMPVSALFSKSIWLYTPQ